MLFSKKLRLPLLVTLLASASAQAGVISGDFIRNSQQSELVNYNNEGTFVSYTNKMLEGLTTPSVQGISFTFNFNGDRNFNNLSAILTEEGVTVDDSNANDCLGTGEMDCGLIVTTNKLYTYQRFNDTDSGTLSILGNSQSYASNAIEEYTNIRNVTTGPTGYDSNKDVRYMTSVTEATRTYGFGGLFNASLAFNDANDISQLLDGSAGFYIDSDPSTFSYLLASISIEIEVDNVDSFVYDSSAVNGGSGGGAAVVPVFGASIMAMGLMAMGFRRRANK